MTYKVYIKQDYKAKITGRRVLGHGLGILVAVGVSISLFLSGSSANTPVSNGEDLSVALKSEPRNSDEVIIELPKPKTVSDSLVNTSLAKVEDPLPVALPNPVQLDIKSDDIVTEDTISINNEPEPEQTSVDWREVKIRKGDNLALIFKRLKLSPTTLHKIVHANDNAKALKRIMPGQVLRFDIREGKLHGMEYDVDFDEKLVVQSVNDNLDVAIEDIKLETRVRHASATINNSLYLAGQQAELSDNVIMQLVTIYGWDIDFALNIRKGDHFSVMFEEYYKDGEKVQDGSILAAEFTNQGKNYKAVRFTHADGNSQYYSDTGHSMRKAFLRTPVKFSRISSRFNLRRKHPVLNRIRAHKGVDYAAPTGTPIKATGDGVITYKGTKGGYGRTIVIKHGSIYSTLYAHMSRYGKKLKNGSRVKQGQTIGYIGSSGLATGPHLHYEFRVHGVHRNPLTVKLPKAMRIPDKLMDEFIKQTSPLLAQLDELNNNIKFAKLDESSELLAMNKETTSPASTQ